MDSLQTPVLVLGATSLIGRFAIPQLEAAGTATVALSPACSGTFESNMSMLMRTGKR